MRSCPAPSRGSCGCASPTGRSIPTSSRRAFSNRTRAIVINTPNNPTGKVFTRDELQLIADLCQQWDVIAIADEIYEHIIFDGLRAHADRVAARAWPSER